MLKILVILVLASIGIIMPVGESYAQTQNNMVVFAQIRVQDSGGNLVSYMEVTRITIPDVAKLNQLLDQNSAVFSKNIITDGDQKLEIIKATDVVVHRSATIVSQNLISATNGQRSEVLAIADHDGYPVVPGDKVSVYWTIIRPA